LEQQLANVDNAIVQNDYLAANIRAGYVYVISNRGALGEHVVKIGLTRRLEPLDRINELGDASVPFRFDVHAIHFSEDAVKLENELHDHSPPPHELGQQSEGLFCFAGGRAVDRKGREPTRVRGALRINRGLPGVTYWPEVEASRALHEVAGRDQRGEGRFGGA
jgi:hypothetical protein